MLLRIANTAACVRSVSYTHLVLISNGIQNIPRILPFYKSEGSSLLKHEPPLPARVLSYIPVSYTHLDVYKRQ